MTPEPETGLAGATAEQWAAMAGRPGLMDGQPGSMTEHRCAIALRLAGIGVVALACVVPLAATAGVAARRTVSIATLPWSRVLFAAATLALLGSVAAEFHPGSRRRGRAVALVIGAVLLLAPLFVVAVFELIAALVSPDALPPVLQELPPRGEPRAGMWLLTVGGALVVLSAGGSASEGLRRGAELARGVLRGRAESIGLVLGGAGIALFVAGRYESWMRIDSDVADWNVVAQSAPLLGLASLVGLAVCAACVVACAMRSGAAVASTTVTAGWVATLVPAAMLVVGAATPELTAPAWLRTRLEDLSTRASELVAGIEGPVAVEVPELPADLTVELVVGRGAVMLFAAGLLVGLSGVLFVRAACRAPEPLR